MKIDTGKYTIIQDEEDHHIMIFRNLNEEQMKMMYHAQYTGPLLSEEELTEYLNNVLRLWDDVMLAKMIKEDME